MDKIIGDARDSRMETLCAAWPVCPAHDPGPAWPAAAMAPRCGGIAGGGHVAGPAGWLISPG